MTCTLAEVRAAIAEDVTTTTGLRCSPYLRDQASPPEAMLDIEGPEQMTLGGASGGQVYTAVLLYIDQRSSEKSAQQRCDELRDPFHARSLKQALASGAATDALVGLSYAQVLTPGPLTPVRIGTVDYLACEFPIEFVIEET